MNSRNYIISKIDFIASKIAGIELEYAFDEYMQFHIIEVNPKHIYTKDIKFAELEIQFKDEFKDMFPKENLLISEKEDFHDMSNLIYSIYPRKEFIKPLRIISKDYIVTFHCKNDNDSYIIDECFNIAA